MTAPVAAPVTALADLAYAALVLAAWAFAFAGWVAFSRTMARHASPGAAGTGPSGPRRHLLRGAGLTGLALSLLACRQAQGSSQGWVLWCGVLTLSAMGLVLVLTWTPQRAARAGLTAAAAGTAAGAAAALVMLAGP